MQDAQHDQGVTIAEAAAQLGISSDTVRRRIRRGELAAVQVSTPNGPAWRVLLGSLSTLGSALGAAPSRPSDAEAGYLALTALFTAGGVVGVLTGGKLAGRLPDRTLRAAFAVVIVGLAIYTFNRSMTALLVA
jgi:excisionase family DNA binding protein